MLRSSVPAAGEFSVVTFDVLPEGLVDQILDVFVCVYLHVGELLVEPLPQLDGRPHQLVVGLADAVEIRQFIERARTVPLRKRPLARQESLQRAAGATGVRAIRQNLTFMDSGMDSGSLPLHSYYIGKIFLRCKTPDPPSKNPLGRHKQGRQSNIGNLLLISASSGQRTPYPTRG